MKNNVVSGERKKTNTEKSFFFPCCYRFGLLCSVIFPVVGCFVFPSNIKERTQEHFCAYEIMGLILLPWEKHRHGWSLARKPGAGWRQSCTPANLLASLWVWEGNRGLLLLAAEKRGNKSGREILGELCVPPCIVKDSENWLRICAQGRGWCSSHHSHSLGILKEGGDLSVWLLQLSLFVF